MIATDFLEMNDKVLSKWLNGRNSPSDLYLELTYEKLVSGKASNDFKAHQKDVFTASFRFLEELEKGEFKSTAGAPYFAQHYLDEIENKSVFKETAPFEWPPHVSEEAALADDLNPGVWLNPHNHFSIPLSGRDREVKLLDKFLSDDRPFLIGAIIAPSGAGKTRLISEWMRRYMAAYQDNGWDAGFVTSRNADPWREDRWTPTRNTLIIIDYTYNYDEVMAALIDRFRSGAPCLIRLLVLDHVLPEKLHKDFAWSRSFRDQGLLDRDKGIFFDSFPIILEPQDDESLLLRNVIACAANLQQSEKNYTHDSDAVVRAAAALTAIGSVDEASAGTDAIRRRNAIRHPLFAALMGQRLATDANADLFHLSRRDLITYFFERHQRIPWDEGAQNKHAKTLGPWVGCFVTAATLMRGLSLRDADRTLPQSAYEEIISGSSIDPLDQIAQYSNRVVTGDDPLTIKPFEPDILGETFVLKFVRAHRRAQTQLDVLTKLLSKHPTRKRDEEVAVAFLETIQRLVRNLINDDQTLPEIQEAWQALIDLLQPGIYPAGTLMRQAVSIALCDTIKQCRAATLYRNADLVSAQVDLDDLMSATQSPLWDYSLKATVNFHDWLANTGQISETREHKIRQILIRNLDNAEENWPNLMLAAMEGCLHTMQFVIRAFGLSVNSKRDDGHTALMVAAANGHLHIVKWLILADADCDAISSDIGWTALILASLEGHLEIVNVLIGAGCDVNLARKNNGFSALIAASQEGHIDIVKAILNSGANVNLSRTDNGTTALIVASAQGNFEIVKYLTFKGALINQAKSDNGVSALMVACEAGHIDIVDFLIHSGANINHTRSDDGRNALMSAVQGNHIDVTSNLIDAKICIDTARINDGVTALMIASEFGFLEIVNILIEAGASLDLRRTDNGATALFYASMTGKFDVVDALISAHADVNQGSFNAVTPLIIASENGYLGVAKRLEAAGAEIQSQSLDIGWSAILGASQNGHVDVVNFLIEKGADPNSRKTDNGWSALAIASQEGHIVIVESLLNSGASVNQGSSDIGWTPLMAASFGGHSDIIKLLLESGAEIDDYTKDTGWNALMVASWYGNLRAASVLLSEGANRAAQDFNGRTALELALEAGKYELYDALFDQ